MKHLFIFSSLIFLSFTGFTGAKHTLSITITDLANNEGFVYLEVFNENQESYKRVRGDINNQVCRIVIRDMETGKYGIRYFHDENGNQELDTNLMGIPKEGYGFSNNASGPFGPKDFKEWLFDVKQDTRIEMKTVN